MSFNHQKLKKNGKSIGKTIKHSKRVRIQENENFMHWICSRIHQEQVFMLVIQKVIQRRIFYHV